VRYCLDHPDEVVPGFLDLLRQYAEDPELDDDRAEALFFIVHILGELGETRAFAPLIGFLTQDRRRVEFILGDAMTETMPQVLIGVFDGGTDRLYTVMNDPSVDDFVRHAVFTTWTYQVAVGRIDAEEAEGYLMDCYDHLRPREANDNYVWVAWVESIAYLGFDALKPLVRQAFDRDLVSPAYLDLDDFETICRERRAAPDPMAFLASERVEPFTDTIGTLSEWHDFSPEFSQADDAVWETDADNVTAVWSETVANPFRHVGRNDPCPCGSGKKFKHCCLD
jgi:hypothetical protein